MYCWPTSSIHHNLAELAALSQKVVALDPNELLVLTTRPEHVIALLAS